MRPRASLVVGLVALTAALVAPGLAVAHGDEDEVAALAKQPARGGTAGDRAHSGMRRHRGSFLADDPARYLASWESTPAS